MKPYEDLSVACAEGRLADVKRLVEAGAEVNLAGINGPLISAVHKNQPECVAYLLAHGANLEVRNENKSTPLIFAAFYGHYGIAEMLLAAGAQRDIVNVHGKTAADYARDNNKPAVLALLLADPLQVSFSHRIVDRTMQEVFDFQRKERVTLIRKDDGGVEAVLRDSFNTLDDKEGLRRAFNEHKRAGGKLSEEEVFGQAIAKAKKLPFKPQ